MFVGDFGVSDSLMIVKNHNPEFSIIFLYLADNLFQILSLFCIYTTPAIQNE